MAGVRQPGKNLTAGEIREIARQAIRFTEREDYRSYDNFDALTSPLLWGISKNRPFLQRVLIQLNARTPFSLRWTGVKKLPHVKTLSDMLIIYSMISGSWNETSAAERAGKVSQMLLEKACRGEGTLIWGLNMPYATRFILADSMTPNLYTTVCAGKGIAAWYRKGSGHSLRSVLKEIAIGIDREFGKGITRQGYPFIRYYRDDPDPVPNVNALALHLLAEINILLQEETTSWNYLDQLAGYLISSQNPDGSWYYSEAPGGRWSDGFHTGFILDSLMGYYSVRRSEELYAVIRKGYDFFLQAFIAGDYTPLYHPGRFRMLDSQNNAQIIQTLVTGSRFFGEDRCDMIRRVLAKVVSRMFHPGGWFYFQQKRFITIKTPYFRWSQTPMILALLHAEEYLQQYGKE